MRGEHKKNLKKFMRVVQPYGLTVRQDKHLKVLKGDTVIYSMALSPKGGRECENSIADLVKLGYLPPEAKKVRIR